MKYILEYEEFLLEADDEKIRYSGRYIPPEYANKFKNTSNDKNKSKSSNSFRTPNTVKGTASQKEFDEVLRKAKEKEGNKDENKLEVTLLYYTKQIRPFKEKVTSMRLLQRFDDIGPERSRQQLLVALDSVLMDNQIRLYLERKIIDASTSKDLAELILKYTIIHSGGDSDPFDFKIFSKKFNLNYTQHSANDLRILTNIRRGK